MNYFSKMPYFKKTLLLCFLSIILLSCSKSRDARESTLQEEFPEETYEDEIPVTESPTPFSNEKRLSAKDIISSSAARINTDTSKKFIRTADIKFRVKDVYEATIGIENISTVFNGYVQYTKLKSNINYTTVIPVSADSSLETVYYTVKNNLTIRVPQENMDTLIRSVSKYIDFLDYRTIQANDVTISILKDKLTQKRQQAYSDRVKKAVDKNQNTLEDITEAEQSRLNAQTEKDRALISSLQIKDKIDFSTVSISIYQRESVKRSLLSNYKNTEAFEPGFFKQLSEALHSGWGILKDLIIGLFTIWPIVLIIVIVFVLYFRFLKNKRN